MPDPSFLDSFYNNLLSIDPNYSVSRSDFAAEMSDSSLVASMFEAVKSKSDFFTSNNITSAEALYSIINENKEEKQGEEEVVVEEWTPSNPDEYYESLPMMDKEKVNYDAWKSKEVTQESFIEETAKNIKLDKEIEAPKIKKELEEYDKIYEEKIAPSESQVKEINDKVENAQTEAAKVVTKVSVGGVGTGMPLHTVDKVTETDPYKKEREAAINKLKLSGEKLDQTEVDKLTRSNIRATLEQDIITKNIESYIESDWSWSDILFETVKRGNIDAISAVSQMFKFTDIKEQKQTVIEKAQTHVLNAAESEREDAAAKYALQQEVATNFYNNIDSDNTVEGVNAQLFKDFNAEGSSVNYEIKPGDSYYTSKDGRKIPASIYDGYVNNMAELDSAQVAASEAYDKYSSAVENAGSEKEMLKLMSLDYNQTKRNAVTLGIAGLSTTKNIVYGAQQLAFISNPIIQTLKYFDVVDPMAAAADVNLLFSKFLDDEKEDYNFLKPTAFGDIKNIDGAIDWTLNMSMETLPIVAAMMVSGGLAAEGMLVSAAIAGSSSGGSKFTEMDQSRKEAARLEEVLKKDDNITDERRNYLLKEIDEMSVSDAEYALKGWAFALIEGSSAYLTTSSLISKNFAAFRNVGGVENKLFDKGSKYLANQTVSGFKDGNLEGLGEVYVSVAQNLVDGKPVFNGAWESYTGGFIFGKGMHSMTTIQGLATREFSTEGEVKRMQEFQKEKWALENKLGALQNKLTAGEISVEEKANVLAEIKVIKDGGRIDALDQQMQEAIKEKEDQLTKEGIKNLAGEIYSTNQQELGRLRAKAQDVKASTVSKDSKLDQLKKLDNTYRSINNQQQKFKSKDLFGHKFFAMRAASVYNPDINKEVKDIETKAIENLQEKKGKAYKPTYDEITIESVRIIDKTDLEENIKKADKVNKAFNTDSKVFEDNEAGVEGLKKYYTNKDTGEISEEGDNLIKEVLKGGVNGFYIPASGNKKAVSWVFKENAINNQKPGVPLHEAAHSATKSLMMNDPKAFKEALASLSEQLKLNNSDFWFKMVVEGTNRLETDIDSDGLRELDFEEVFSSFVEELGEGKIKLDPGYLVKFSKLLNQGLKKSDPKGEYVIDFKGENDITEFLESYGRAGIKSSTETKATETKVEYRRAASTTGSTKMSKTAPIRNMITAYNLEKKELVADQVRMLRNDIDDNAKKTENVNRIKDINKEVEILEDIETIRLDETNTTRADNRLYQNTKDEVNKTARAITNSRKFFSGIAPEAATQGMGVSTYKEARELYEATLKSDLSTMIKNEWNPEIEPDLGTFVRNRGYLRAYSLATKLGVASVSDGGIGITKDLEHAGDVMIEEDISIEAKQVVDPIVLHKRLGPEAANIDEVVKDISKDIDPSNITYKTLKDLTPDLTQELFGISPKLGNLTKTDVRNAQMFIAKNVDILIAMLPEGATPSGTATGVQNVLLKEFYTKKDRATMGKTGSAAGLAVQVKKPNINKSDFLEVFGITQKGEQNLYKKESNTSSRIKALVEQTGRLLTNQAVRQEMALREVPESTIQRISEGKSNVMFSKTVRELSGVGVKFSATVSGLPVDAKSDFRLRLRHVMEGWREFVLVNDGLAPDKNDMLKILKEVYGTGFEYSANGKAVKNKGEWNNLGDIKVTNDMMTRIAKEIVVDLSYFKNSVQNKNYLKAIDNLESKTELEMIDKIDAIFVDEFSVDKAKTQLGVDQMASKLAGDKIVVEEVIGIVQEVARIIVNKFGADGVVMIHEMHQFMTHSSDPKRMGVFQSPKADYFANIVEPAAEASGFVVKQNEGNGISVFSKDGELVVKTSREATGKHASSRILNKSFVKDGKIDINNPKLKEIVKSLNEDAELSRKFLDEFYLSVTNMLQSGLVSPKPVFLLQQMLKASMQSPLRTAAKLVGVYIPSPGETIVTGSEAGKGAEWEHYLSAEVFSNKLLKIYVNNTLHAKDKTKLTPENQKLVDELYDMYIINIIPEAMNKEINSIGYQVNPPPLDEGNRLYNERNFGSPNVRAIQRFDGSVEGIEWAKAAELAIGKPELISANSEIVNESNVINTKYSKTKLNNTDVLSLAATLDASLNNARNVNAPVKKIRVFDFDDTLANTSSRVIYKKPNTTGKSQPRLKAVMLAGSPGAGKSTVVEALGLEKQGYKVVNQDISLEWAKKLVGLSESEVEYSAVESSMRAELGGLARKIAERKLDKFTSAGKGVVLDGTGASLKMTKAKIKALEDLGYDVKMIYVETSKEEALKRNAARKERSLKDFIVNKSWDQVNANKVKYQEILGENFFDLNTESLEQGSIPKEFKDRVNNNLKAFEKGRLAAGSYASVGTQMEAEGAEFDFREFDIVVDGKEGPLLNIAKKIQEARGTEDVFVLTARGQNAAGPIKEFLKSVGLDLPIDNITGLGDSSPFAKSQWLVEKAAEGYNDFYFADDHGANVEAVREALKELPVKSKVQQAKYKDETKFSLTTKRDLKWEVVDDAYDEFDTIETKFKIKDSEYSISMDVVSDTHLVESGIADFATDGGFEGSGIDIQKLQEYVYKSNLRPEGAVTSFDMSFYFHNYKHENLEKMSSWKKEMLGGYVKDASMTETGNAIPLLSIVINGLKKKFNESKSNEILSFVSKNEGGRTSLYRFLARELSKEMGLEVFTTDILDLTFVGRTNQREHSVVGTKFVLMKESLLKKSGAYWKFLNIPGAKFSLTAKRDLNWTEFKGAMGFATGQKTTFMVKGKEYEIALGKSKKEHIEEKILDIGYRNAVREAGYDIEAIESRISAKRKPNMIDASFFKINYITGLEPNKWYGPDGADQSIELKRHAQADGDGIVRIKEVDITGDGDASEVLGVVMNGVIKKYRKSPGNVAITFSSFEPSRTRLYNTIANLFAKELNLEVFNSEVSEVYGTEFFLLSKEILGERKKITELDAESEVKFSLTTSKKLKWKSRSEESDITTFKSEGKDYFIATDKDIFSNTAVFEFGTYDADQDLMTYNELNYELTNIGNSREVFGTVINGMIGYIKKNNIDTVRFNSTGYKRTRLYASMAKVFAKQLGWNWKAEVFETTPSVGLGIGETMGEFEMSEYELPIDKPNEMGNWDKSRAKFSLTTKRDLKWENVPLLKRDGSPSDRIQDKASFNIKGKEYNIKSTRDGVGSKWEYANLVFDLGGDVGMTKTGDAGEVISIVSNALFDYVKKNPNIREYAWSADGGSRNRLYKRLTKFWAEKLGMEYTWNVAGYQAARRLPPAPGRPPGTGGIGLVDEVYGQYMVSKDKLPESTDKTLKPDKIKAELTSIHELPGNAPVQDVLNVVDVNRPQQVQRRAKFSKTNLDKRFNMILEESKGVDHYKEFSEAKGKVIGAGVKKQKFFLPPSAEDFLGLLYPTLGKGSQGEGHLDFYQESLLRPYARGVDNLATDRKVLMEDFKELKKTLKVPKDLRKVTKSGFSKEQAVRVWLWENTEQEIYGISKTDKAELLKIVENEPTLKLFAEQILNLTKGDGYSTPKEHWLTGTITTDLIDLLNTTKRAKYLAEWKENSDIIFSKPNLNKLESVFGSKYREAMEQMIHTMKTGRNRGSSSNRLSNMALDYINGSVGVIMFTNMRSALLQGISSANFVNWSFNNPYNAGKSYVNVPQFVKDFKTIINSDYLVDRRNGLKLNIHENEIANAAKTSKNKANAILNLIIEKGYAPTKFMDSFAIALGGSSYYRNRIKDLMKKNPEMKKEIAEARAFEEMRELSELTQQSSDPSKISQQQSSDLGRLVLQFVNTPMQYTRLQKRAVQDLANGRGDAKQHISRIIYYGFVQNVMFNALQQAYFAVGFGDPDEDEVFTKKLDVVDGMLDSSLRGLGLGGVTMGVFKDVVYDIYKRSKRDRPNFKEVWKQLLGFSPAISSKVKKAINAGWAFDSKDRRAQMKEGFGIDNPAWEAGTGVVSAVGNVPVDRILKKIQNLRSILKEETEAWKDVAMFFGWPEWQLDIKQKPTAEEIEAEKQVKKEEEEKVVKSRIKKQINYLNDLSKKEQVHKLDSLGVSASEIKDLKLEKNRVDKLYELMGEDTPYAKVHASIPTEERSKQQRRLYRLDKVNQIETLRSLGATDSVINTLKYEFDRVKKIEELYEKNK